MSNKTQDDIVCFALRLIQQKGYTSFSYDDIAKQLNITKAAIHYHFQSKEDLGLTICKRVETELLGFYNKNMENIKNNTGTPWDFIDGILALIKPDENCPISSLQSNFESLSDDFKDEIKRLSELQMKLFFCLVKQYSPKIDEMLVTTLFLSVKGALQYRRILGEVFFNQTIKAINDEYNRLVSLT